MRADPEPGHAIRNRDTERPVVQADTDRPKISDPLEVKRRMARIGLQELEILIREIADV